MLPCQRNHFSLPADAHYLNCAYMSPLSKRVQAAGIAGIQRKSNPADISSEDFFIDVATARRLFARLINSPTPEHIAIVPSVSYGVSTVARNTSIRSGQNVVILHDQFPSNVYPWRRLCAERQACLRVVAPPVHDQGRGEAWNAAVVDAIDADTAVVAVPNVHWTDGTWFDLEAISSRARDMSAAFIVDGTQSIGAAPFDVERLQPDAVLCAAYKWLGGPYSIGAAYYGSRYHDGIPLEEGWMARTGSEDFNRLVDYRDVYRPGATRFDVGEISNFVLVPMMVAALEQVLEWGSDNVAPYCRALTGSLVTDLEQAGFDVAEERWRSDHMFGFRVPSGYDLNALRNRLSAGRVSVALRGGAVRVSPYLYNDEDDVAALRIAIGL